MNNRNKTILGISAFYLTTIVLFLLPDALFFTLHRHLPLCFFHEKMLVLAGLMLLASFMRSNRAVYCFFAVFGLMHAVQLCCLAYFGTSLNPFTVSLLFEEIEDVFSETVHMTGYLWYVPLIVALPYFACAKLICACKNRFTFSYAWTPVLAVFVAFGVQSHVKPDLLMRSYCYPAFNTLTAFTAYFGNILPKQIMQKDDSATSFKPYVVTKKVENPDINVVLIMGESLNRNHFSLYGYARKTTPKLENRAAKGEIIFKESLSGGVNTLIAVPNFLHVQREPQNYKKQLKSDTYLPKLAKENGFKTAYVGLQGKAVYTKEALSFFDKSYVFKLSKEKCAENVCIADALNDFSFDKPAFVMIQKRNPHAPYEEHYPQEYAVFNTNGDDVTQARINTYDNALLYEDFLIDNLLTYLQEKTNRPTYVFYVSDHGEAMGEDGKFGHSFIAPAVTEIPFIYALLNGQDDAFASKIKDAYIPTAYEVGKFIAEKLGYNIVNPNEDGKTFYTNGHNKMGKAGYIVIEKDGASKSLKRTVVQGTEKE